MPIAKPSVQSLLLRMRANGSIIATGTGFVADSGIGPVLLTNRHNATGRRQDDGQPLSPTGAVPDEVEVIHNRKGRLGEWFGVVEPLLSSEGAPLWKEHPSLGPQADFVALPLSRMDDVDVYPHTLGKGDPPIAVGPADTVSVVGFPFGLQAGGSLAVWATGFVASEPEINLQDLPLFLIDCRTRQGQSGSAVLAYRNGGMVAMEDGGSAAFTGPVSRFLGIYSGRVNAESDIGLVWKASALVELVESIPNNGDSA